MSQSNELKYLKSICFQVEQRLSWGAPLDWTNSSFIELSNEVKRASGVRISADTLKRIFGKVKTAEQYNPQLATKDALSVFLEYASWSDFKLQNPQPSEELIIVPSTPLDIVEIPAKRPFRLVAILISVLVIALWFIFRSESEPETIDYSTFPFSIEGKYLRGNAYHTVVFDYSIGELSTDSVFLDFGDETKRNLLNKDNHTISHYYRGPGQYTVRLIADNQEVYDTTVYLSTDDWEAHTFFSKSGLTEYLPIYDFRDTLSGLMSVHPSMPRIKGIDTTQMYWVQYANYKDYGQDGDNFELVSELMNNQEIISARCNHVRIEIVGEKSAIKLYFLREGCSKWVRLQFSNVHLNGENKDLSAFGKDFMDFEKVTIKNSEKVVQVYYNDSLLIEQAYQESLGKITGIVYIFSGVGGAVKSSKLNDLSLDPQ